MGEQSASAVSRAAIAAAVEESLARMTAAAVDAIWAEGPGYASSTDAQLKLDVAAHVAAIFDVFLDGLAEDRPARRGNFSVTREQASRRLTQGISLADFLQAFRIGQITLWQGVLDAARTV